MRTRICRALRIASDRGASAVEYGLLVAAIAAVIVGVVFAFGRAMNDTFTTTKVCIENQGHGKPYPDCGK